jgi:hypothetical protein
LLIDTIQAEVDVGEDGDVATSSYTTSRALHAKRYADNVSKTFNDMLSDIDDSVEVINNSYTAGSEVCTQFGCHTAKGDYVEQYDV